MCMASKEVEAGVDSEVLMGRCVVGFEEHEKERYRPNGLIELTCLHYIQPREHSVRMQSIVQTIGNRA